MFDEQFFDHLDQRVNGYRRRSGNELAAVVVRTRWGMFNVARVRAEDLILGLSVYAGPSPASAEGGEEGEDPPAPEKPAPDPDAPPPCAELYVPYAEIISVELYPGAESTAYLGGELGDAEPLIGFNRT